MFPSQTRLPPVEYTRVKPKTKDGHKKEQREIKEKHWQGQS